MGSNQERVITTPSQLDEAINRFRQDQLISSFLEIATGETTQTAIRFLKTTDWKIDEAINLFLATNHGSSSTYHHDQDADSTTSESSSSDDSDPEETDPRLSSSSFSPPAYRLHENSFEHAKSISTQNNLWLIVNLQSKTGLASRTLNRDVWRNYDVSRTVTSKFILWQVYNDSIQGQKISTFYKIESAPPVVLLIDPITGQKMDMWSGVIEADSFVEGLMKFTDAGPQEHIASLTRNRTNETCLPSNKLYQTPRPSWGEEFEEEDIYSPDYYYDPFEDEDAVETWSSSSESSDHFVPPFIGEEYEDPDEVKEETCLVFPVLTGEPKGDCDGSLVCSVAVRFPDGRRKQRKFLKSEPIQLLWSFCYTHMDEYENKAFKLVQAIPGASKTLDYGANVTFEQSGLANSMISVSWE